MQVTSSSDLAKAKKTVAKFNEKDLHEKYDQLIILNISTKRKHKNTLIGSKTKHQFDPSKDVWDISDLLKKIGDMPIDKVSQLRSFLETQVTFQAKETVAKEITTFQSLIKFLSDENHPAIGDGFIEEPDPSGKIEERFADYTEFLKSEFKDLYSEYGNVLSDVRKHSDLGHVRLRRLRMHLKTHSDRVLSTCGGNAKSALNILVEEFEVMLSKSSIEYDTSAIRFFLIDELIRCNVFPNKEAANV